MARRDPIGIQLLTRSGHAGRRAQLSPSAWLVPNWREILLRLWHFSDTLLCGCGGHQRPIANSVWGRLHATLSNEWRSFRCGHELDHRNRRLPLLRNYQHPGRKNDVVLDFRRQRADIMDFSDLPTTNFLLVNLSPASVGLSFSAGSSVDSCAVVRRYLILQRAALLMLPDLRSNMLLVADNSLQLSNVMMVSCNSGSTRTLME